MVSVFVESTCWAFFLKEKTVAQCQVSMNVGLDEACGKYCKDCICTLSLQVLRLPVSMFKASCLVFSVEKSKQWAPCQGHPASPEGAARSADLQSPFAVGVLELEQAVGSQKELAALGPNYSLFLLLSYPRDQNSNPPSLSFPVCKGNTGIL